MLSSRKLLFFSVVALLALLAFVARPGTAAVSRFSDREIFEGALFGVGPVASVLPEVRDQLRPEIYAHGADELAAMASARDRLISSIESVEPGFITEFARVARSGDPAAIRSMLERAADVVNAVSGVVRDDAPIYANVPHDPRPEPMRPAPGPRPTPPNVQPQYANVPHDPRPEPMRPAPGPRPTPPNVQPQYANVPHDPRPEPMRPSPGPRPTPPSVHPLYANVPHDPRPGPSRPTPGPRPAPTQLASGPALIDPAAAQPAWSLFASRLFSEQLAASMATTLDGSVPAGG
jgi:hypothetical protein